MFQSQETVTKYDGQAGGVTERLMTPRTPTFLHNATLGNFPDVCKKARETFPGTELCKTFLGKVSRGKRYVIHSFAAYFA